MNTLDTTDVRAGWTSASNASADAACPGRHLAQRDAPQSTSKYSQSGRKIHEALAQFTSVDRKANRPLWEHLSLEEQETYHACRELASKLTVQYFGTLEPTYREFKEQRYWAKFKAGGVELAHSGQADLVARSGNRALIIDYKTLPGDVPESAKNLQLRDLACLVRGHFVPTDEVAVAIVQPFVTRSPELCVYRKADLERATQEMFQRVFASNAAGSPRIAGELQCKFCRAKSGCVEYQKWAGQITPPAMLSVLSVPMAAWSPQQCAIAAAALGPCEKFLDEMKAMLKQRLTQDPAAVPGWELKPGAMRESINNPQGVYERFAALGGKVEQFMPCVDVAKGRLRDALNELTGAKGKSLDTAMKTLTDGFVESKQAAPSLKRMEDKT